MIKIPELRKLILKKKKEIIFLSLFLILSFWVYMTDIPQGFKPNSVLVIEEGETLSEVAEELKQNELIRVKSLFITSLVVQNKDKKIVPGEYLFDKPISVFEIGRRITTGKFGFPSKTITLKEGLTLEQMANILGKELPKFDANLFLEETAMFEGFYFPDTYIFPENVKTEKVIETLQKNFQKKMSEIDDIISSSKKSMDEIIIMASIVEKEATAEARQEVANILWHRIDIDMPLQVDATFVYSIDKHSFNVTKDEMKDKDNPYNTYVHKGLPPTAICNPGLESIKAAANQQDTENLFFLTGNDGEMYYAETHDEHVANKTKYLK